MIDAYVQRMKAAGRSEYTIGARCRVLRRADRLMPGGLAGATTEDVLAFLADTRTDWTRYGYFSHLRGFYRATVAAGLLAVDPTVGIERPKPGDRLPHPVTDDELSAAVARSPDMPWRTAVILAAYAGLRCAEITGLDRRDVNADQLYVRRGKGGKARYVPTHPEVWAAVSGLPAGQVLRSLTGRAVTAEHLTTQQWRHWRGLGMPEVHMHRFRHWFGTSLAEAGVGIEVIAGLMGHSSLDITRGYVMVSGARRRAAVAALPGLAA